MHKGETIQYDDGAEQCIVGDSIYPGRTYRNSFPPMPDMYTPLHTGKFLYVRSTTHLEIWPTGIWTRVHELRYSLGISTRPGIEPVWLCRANQSDGSFFGCCMVRFKRDKSIRRKNQYVASKDRLSCAAKYFCQSIKLNRIKVIFTYMHNVQIKSLASTV